MVNNTNINTKIKILFNDSTLGPGLIQIMDLVKETESLSKAYKAMGLSSSKGWKIIKNAEENLGFPIFSSTVGGVGGGSTKLTAEGENLLINYKAFVDELNIQAEKLYEKYFG